VSRGRKRTASSNEKPGRKLEQLVAKLETALAGTKVEVKSPDMLPDSDTGEMREVDVSLRVRVGSASLLIIAECRDRGRMQGVEWIEQLLAKGRSVGAQKVVAVSSNGFTANALKKAKQQGLDLRTLAGLSAEQIRRWVPFEGLGITQRQFKAIHWRFRVSASPDGDLDASQEVPVMNSATTTQAKVFQCGEEAELFSADDLFDSLIPHLRPLAERAAPTHELLPMKPLAAQPVSGTSPASSFGVEVRIPNLQLILDDRRGFVKWAELLVEVTTNFATISISDGEQYGAAGDSAGPPFVARYDVAHNTPILPKKLELLVFPAEERFTLSSIGTDGVAVELFTGPTVVPFQSHQ
jgi:hypothetical protein